jgi:hypothetical protein
MVRGSRTPTTPIKPITTRGAAELARAHGKPLQEAVLVNGVGGAKRANRRGHGAGEVLREERGRRRAVWPARPRKPPPMKRRQICAGVGLWPATAGLRLLCRAVRTIAVPNREGTLTFARTFSRGCDPFVLPHLLSRTLGMAKKRKRKYSRGAGTEVKREMHRYKRGKAKSGKGGKGGKVKSRKQAIAIALTKARKKGKKVPRKKK